jgi:hypothetical protein
MRRRSATTSGREVERIRSVRYSKITQMTLDKQECVPRKKEDSGRVR